MLAPAFVLAGGLVGLALVTELRLARASGPPSSADRTAILIQVLLVGFLAFAGVATLVPGRPARPARPAAGSARTRSPSSARRAPTADRVPARLSRRRDPPSNLRDVTWFGLTGAVVVAIAAVALRSIEIPRILGPALLVLVFFLWDAIHSGGRRRGAATRGASGRRSLLALLAIVVIGWSIGIRP